MYKLNMDSAIKRYNDLMFCIGYEHVSINTSFSESTESWNIRDMVAECDYLLSTYYESGHANADMKEECRESWVSETGRLKRFIATYSKFIDGVVCVSGHCSKYDNKPKLSI